MHNATKESFVVLDELGRGTSTFDGIAIATAVLEHFIEKVQCPLVFCTHYHVITQQFQGLAMVRNASMKYLVGEKLVLLHKIVDGPCSSSFGCEVARMCGLPEDLTREAQEVANDFERRHKALHVAGSETQVRVVEMRPELQKAVEDLKMACGGSGGPTQKIGRLLPVIAGLSRLNLE
jgi:DNA mismatch repair ATPase MutS